MILIIHLNPLIKVLNKMTNMMELVLAFQDKSEKKGAKNQNKEKQIPKETPIKFGINIKVTPPASEFYLIQM